MGTCSEKLIVSNAGSDSLSIIDMKENRKIEEIYILSLINKNKNKNLSLNDDRIGPHHIVKSNSDTIYSVNSYDNSIYKINLKNKEIENVVFVGRFPSHMEKVENYIYVTNSDSNSVTIIDDKDFSILENIPVGERPHDIKIDKANDVIYVTNSGGYSIDIINIKKNTNKRVTLDCNPLNLYLSKNIMFILCYASNGVIKSKIKALNLSDGSIIKDIEVDGVIVDMIYLEHIGIIYVTNAENGCLYKIDFENGYIINKYNIGGMLNNIICIRNKLYITDALNNKVLVFDYNRGEITCNIDVGIEPNGLLII
ncbi:40-residue YVTN family beta-propeller repeat domain-containing protein [Gottschalkia purinilytica]|uniref:40-residue YVTN family beta-propeller repeat domain-containing protein n=1 Tax=Gottschalkia purinilytica TaxID=1503 RepID=A0A0L0W8P4_GOTPU|nr:YncE family protein [Gottschalkia purinilytica]KNF07660.1 40-residue YVTN family beta-propeller repeat domain-containing protein [Gottschalkia purinilytica]